jgi:hypothetical protein
MIISLHFRLKLIKVLNSDIQTGQWELQTILLQMNDEGEIECLQQIK